MHTLECEHRSLALARILRTLAAWSCFKSPLVQAPLTQGSDACLLPDCGEGSGWTKGGACNGLDCCRTRASEVESLSFPSIGGSHMSGFGSDRTEPCGTCLEEGLGYGKH